jgi:hypothetical protein
MSKHEKLIAKLLNKQAVFTWQELAALLRGLGYRQIEGDGSRVKFDNGDPQAMINMHKPHPGNELKSYAKRQVIEHPRGCEKTPTYCGRLQTPAAALRYVKNGVI